MTETTPSQQFESSALFTGEVPVSAPGAPAGEAGWETAPDPDDVSGAVSLLRADVDALTDAMETLVSIVEDMRNNGYGAGPGAPGGGGSSQPGSDRPSRWAWRYSTKANAGKLWAELREFVDWINTRYSLDSERQIPPCWYRHSVGVEELTALMASWQAVYIASDEPRDDMLAWHAHWLWSCLDRLPERAGWQRCRGGHLDRTAMVRTTDESFDDFVARQQAGP